MFLMICGCSCSQKPIYITKIEKVEIPAVYLEEYDNPPEPQDKTIKSMLEYMIAQRAINARHNADKQALKDWNLDLP